MRVRKFTAGFLLTTAIISATNLIAAHAMAAPARVSCLCDCPDDYKARPRRHAERPAAHAPRRIARAPGYDYAAARPAGQYGWHGQWRQAPNDAVIDVPPDGYIPSPDAYGPPPGYDDRSIQVDNNGWSGGVGYGGEGGGGGGGDSFGQVHFGTGGSVENGPTYNSYNQSFQYNPSQPGAFQPRLMGGFAPPPSK